MVHRGTPLEMAFNIILEQYRHGLHIVLLDKVQGVRKRSIGRMEADIITIIGTCEVDAADRIQGHIMNTAGVPSFHLRIGLPDEFTDPIELQDEEVLAPGSAVRILNAVGPVVPAAAGI